MFNLITLDNHRQILNFNIDINNYSQGRPIFLDLKTKKRDFHIAIAKDSAVDKVIIKNSKYGNVNNQDFVDNDGVSRIYTYKTENNNIVKQDELVFNYEDTFDIEIHYKDYNYAVMNHLIKFYLKDCFTSIGSSNGGIQTIRELKMPKRDILLFLKTEQQYTLTIFRESSSTHIKSIAGIENNEDFPIIEKHYWNDYILLPIIFTAGDGKYYEIDQDYLRAQLASIQFRSHDPDINCTYLNTNFPEKCEEYHSGRERDYDKHIFIGDEYVYFYMPDYDLTLYIKEIKPHVRLSFSLINQSFTNYISEVYVTSQKEEFKSLNLRRTINYPTTMVENTNYVDLFPNTNINVYVKFSNLKIRLDTDYLDNQILNVCNKPGRFFLMNGGTKNDLNIPPQLKVLGINTINISNTYSTSNNNAKMYQQFNFDIDEIKSSTKDKVLKLKWEDRYYSFNVNYISSYLLSDIDIKRNGLTIFKDDLNRLYEGDNLIIRFNLKKYYVLDTNKENNSTLQSTYLIDGSLKDLNLTSDSFGANTTNTTYPYKLYNDNNYFQVYGCISYIYQKGNTGFYGNINYFVEIRSTIQDIDIVVNTIFKLANKFYIYLSSYRTYEKRFYVESPTQFHLLMYGGNGGDGWYFSYNTPYPSYGAFSTKGVWATPGQGGTGWCFDQLVSIYPGEVILKIEEGTEGGRCKISNDANEAYGGWGGPGGPSAYLIYNDEKGDLIQLVAFGGGGGGGPAGYDGSSGGTGSGGGGAGNPGGKGFPGPRKKETRQWVEVEWDYSGSFPKRKYTLKSETIEVDAIPNFHVGATGTFYSGGTGGRGENSESPGGRGGHVSTVTPPSFTCATGGFGGQAGGGGGAPSCGGGGGSGSHYQQACWTFGENAPIFKPSFSGTIRYANNSKQSPLKKADPRMIWNGNRTQPDSYYTSPDPSYALIELTGAQAIN
jgi:hypothetical protein